LLHSIVDNNTGSVLANAHQVFANYGFCTVPHKSQGVFILEEQALQAKIDEVRRQVLGTPVCETHEGAVLQLVDRDTNTVVQLVRVKCVEY
jgi:hypothetical protein